MILVDSSLWIESFRRGGVALDDYVDIDDVVTCLPIVQEVLQGFRDERAWRVAREAMFAIPMLESPLRAELFDEAASLYRLARSRGFTIRASADCLIAVCALRNGVPVYHCDRDFTALSRVSALQSRAITS